MKELWKSIPKFDKYEVSNEGHIHKILPDDSILQIDKPRTANVRRKVVLYKTDMGRGCEKYIDELVANAFLEKPTKTCKLVHINHDKTDDSVTNLSWLDSGVDLRTITTSRKNYRSVQQISLDGDVIAKYVSIREASRSTGVSYQGIFRCCTGEQSTAGGHRWVYSDSETGKIIPRACPICGSEIEIIPGVESIQELLSYSETGIPVMIKCPKCGLSTRVFDSESKLISYWNDRVR